jgi:hypothetical protein
VTWYLSLLLLLQPVGVAPRTPQPPASQETPATSPAVTYDHGPLRLEVAAMFDARYWYREEQPGARPSELRLQLRVMGERISEVARAGSAIFTEAVDDTGRALVAPDTYTQEERTNTRPVTLPAERVRADGLRVPAQLKSSARAAKTLKLRGTIRLILAKEREHVTIDRPLQYIGKIIENKRLKELGIEIRFVPADELPTEGETPPSATRTPTLHFRQGYERIQSVAFHDAYMKPIRHRERPVQTKQGVPVTAFALGNTELTDECQLVLEVFPQMEDLQLPIAIDNLELP